MLEFQTVVKRQKFEKRMDGHLNCLQSFFNFFFFFLSKGRAGMSETEKAKSDIDWRRCFVFPIFIKCHNFSCLLFTRTLKKISPGEISCFGLRTPKLIYDFSHWRFKVVNFISSKFVCLFVFARTIS